MDPDEIEFIGENNKIGVIPNFTFDPIHLISGSIGPFRAGLPVHVPLWLAVHLRKQQKCRIVPPDWMDIDHLEDIKEEEKRSRFFTKMPNDHFMIEAKLILATASEDVPRSEEIRTIIKDIWDIRAAKLRSSMDAFIKGEGTYAKLDNLTMLEIHSVRPLLPHSLDLIARLRKTIESSASSASALPLSTTTNTTSSLNNNDLSTAIINPNTASNFSFNF